MEHQGPNVNPYHIVADNPRLKMAARLKAFAFRVAVLASGGVDEGMYFCCRDRDRPPAWIFVWSPRLQDMVCIGAIVDEREMKRMLQQP